MSKSVVVNTRTPLEFDEMLSRKHLLPESLSNSFGEDDFPVFSIDEVAHSESLLREILDTEMVVMSCDAFDKEKGVKLNGLLAKVINQTKCPILLIPENVKDPEGIQKLVLNSDIRFTELRFLRTLGRISDCLKSSLTLAHVSESGIPDLNVTYGQSLFKDSFEGKVGISNFNLEVLKRLDVQKYPDLIHDYLMGDIYALVNKNPRLNETDFLNGSAVRFARKGKKPVLVINSAC